MKKRLLAPALAFTLAIAPLVGLTALVTTQTACPQSASLASISGRVERGLNVAIPIFQQNGQNAVILIQARDLAHRAKLAFDISDGVQGAALVARLITLFEGDLLAQIARIPNAATRTILLVALAIANDQLHELADRLAKESKSVMRSVPVEGANVIQDFRAKPRWHCRNLQSGSIVDMGYCKASPATGVVETF